MLTSGCGGGGSAPIVVTLSSTATQTDAVQGLTVSITATVTNDVSGDGVGWSLTGPGSLSSQAGASITYNAPASVASAVTATITATSVAAPSVSAQVAITVNPPPQITTTALSGGVTGMLYNQSVIETGGSAPFTWSVNFGAVPLGLSLSPTTGAISGTPTGGGTWSFDVEVSDAAGVSQYSAPLSISISSNSAPGNPVPFVSQPLVPDAAAPAGAGFTLTVNGAGFISGATVNFNGVALPTTFVSGLQLTAAVPAADIASAGTASIAVINPTPGGGSSNVVYFPIATPETTVNFANASGSPITGINLPLSVAVGDFNGDSKPDLAIGGDPGISVLLGNGDGTFNQASGSPISMFSAQQGTDPLPAAVVVGDFNNSGKLGIAVADAGYAINNVPVLLGNGDGTFTLSTGPGNTNNYSSCSMAAADFNADGNLDLAITNDLYGMAILLGYGDGAFNPAAGSPIQTPLGSCFVAVGDFNGDGKLDLAIANSNGNTVTILLGNGDGTFTQALNSPITVGNAPGAIVAGDFNGDGKTDIAVANYADNTVTILLGNGDGTFTAAAGSPISVGTSPDAIAVGDFLGNGELDLAVANSGSNNVTLMLGNGNGTFTQAANSPFAVGNTPVSIAVADFNGDGRLDLVVTDSGDNTVYILLQQ